MSTTRTLQGSKYSKIPSSESPRRRRARQPDELGVHSDSDDSVRFQSFPISRENGKRTDTSSSKRQAQPPVHPRSPKTLSSIAEHPVSPKLERRESKSVSFSLNPMESPFAPTRTATHAGYINRQVSMPVHAPMYSSSSSSSTFFHSSPTSFPSDLRYQTPPLFRPGPPPLDDEPNVGCGSSSLALVTYMFKRFKKVSSNNNNSHKKDDSPHSHAPNSNHKKLRRTATAPVEREEKRPNRRGYYRFTDEEMEQQNLTRGQLMAWRADRVRSHILHDGDFLYQGSNNNSQMGYQGVPITFMIPPQ